MQINKKTGNIIGEYFDEAFKNNRLFSFEVDLDQRCNANCVFCFQGEKTPNTKERMSLGKYKELFLEAKQLGGYYIGFAGGEPFCNPNALDIMEMAQIFGYRVGVITNGHLLDNQMIERLIQMNLSRISISFHGFKKETYARHFGVDERFYNEVVNKIIQLVNGGCHVGIAYTVTKNNIDEFFDTKKMFMDIGLSGKDIKFNMLIQGDKDVQHLYPSVEQLEKLINLRAA